MVIAVNHSISDPAEFWNLLSSNPAVPEGFKVRSVLPGTNPSQAICIWEAPDQQALEGLVGQFVGHCSHNTFMPVNAEQAIGL